ncbi:MAG: hypothetical protein IKW12_05155 [Clostridia bacterium]|nr:hypothetical protein [Clostridia bacterium]
MKKFISIILTATFLIISSFSVNAFAQEQTRTEKWIQNYTDYEFEAKITNNINDEKSGAKMYVKDGNFAIICDFPLSYNITTKIKIVIKDGYFYVYSPYFPFISLKIESPDDMLILSEAEKLTYIQSYEEQIGSDTYYVEEFTNEFNAITKSYFLGNDLVKTESELTDEYGNYESSVMEIVSHKVRNSVFFVPLFSIELSTGDISLIAD